LLQSLGLEIPIDPRTGIVLDMLNLATRNRSITACRMVSNDSKPLGCVMPDARKRDFPRLTAARGVAGIEDHIYSDLHRQSDLCAGRTVIGERHVPELPAPQLR